MKKLIKRLYEYFYSYELHEEKTLKICLATDILCSDCEMINLMFERKYDELEEYIGLRYHLVNDELEELIKVKRRLNI